MLIDTHAHINDTMLQAELPQILQDLETGIVQRIVCPSCDFTTMQTALNLAESNAKVFCALGIHPQNATQYNIEVQHFLQNNASNPKVVAIGEIGLDYHYPNVDKEKQKEVLLQQMEIAHFFNLPIIFHIRDAFEDFWELINNNRSLISNGGVVHCFEGDNQDGQKAISYHLNIGLTGLITFKNRTSLREVVANIPLKNIILETDSPYLAPEPNRGKICTPDKVQNVANKLAEIKGCTLQDVEDITTSNAYKLFVKMREFENGNQR